MTLQQQREQLEKELLKAVMNQNLEAARKAKNELDEVYKQMNLTPKI